MHMNTLTNTRTCTQTNTHEQNTHICTVVNTNPHIHTHTHMHTDTHAHTCTHTLRHTKGCFGAVCSQFCSPSPSPSADRRDRGAGDGSVGRRRRSHGASDSSLANSIGIDLILISMRLLLFPVSRLLLSQLIAGLKKLNGFESLNVTTLQRYPNPITPNPTLEGTPTLTL